MYGTWSLGECHSKRRVHTYVRKSALVFTMILLETHPTELLYLQLKWLFALFLCESSLNARETRPKDSPYKRYYLRLTII